MHTKRKWARYLRGEPNYDNGLRCVLPTASGAVRKAIKSADQRHGDHDTSHLLVEETLHRKTGGTTKIQFYHPVKIDAIRFGLCSKARMPLLRNRHASWRPVCMEAHVGLRRADAWSQGER